MSANLEKINELFERRDTQGIADLGGPAQIAKTLLETNTERGLETGVAASRTPKNTYPNDQKAAYADLVAIEIADYVVVRGEGDSIQVKGADLVRGDILKLKEGDIVPVDALVLNGLLMVDESDLTGETDLCAKAATTDCFLLGGTKIREGACTCVVLNVGSDSNLSKTAAVMTCNADDEENLK